MSALSLPYNTRISLPDNTRISLFPSAQNGSAASIASSFIEDLSLDASSYFGALQAGDLLNVHVAPVVNSTHSASRTSDVPATSAASADRCVPEVILSIPADNMQVADMSVPSVSVLVLRRERAV